MIEGLIEFSNKFSSDPIDHVVMQVQHPLLSSPYFMNTWVEKYMGILPM